MPRKDRLRREWDDMVNTLRIGSIVTTGILIERLNHCWWTPVRVGSYLRIDPRFEKIGEDKRHKGYHRYVVVG